MSKTAQNRTESKTHFIGTWEKQYINQKQKYHNNNYYTLPVLTFQRFTSRRGHLKYKSCSTQFKSATAGAFYMTPSQ